ncbi:MULTISPECIES: hypothetical protein [Prauserella salsuginis group]|uniref:DUF4352 domain-containing protein n=2 Tax=Prauserella salsuginis group TaxID=2893672 RepID=A0A839XT59_9PSEU|nr:MULTISPECIES: hypothetical protein [Prauserella salsuginis group]MBB3666390.1 hypothetical protein [Prauserella sediminis]MCR3719115.1 protein of unknown function (DUF4352) [Prauserella flava]MCR3732636.1 protein of unknown function (DUF4352) [Prauserella salsuginis]
MKKTAIAALLLTIGITTTACAETADKPADQAQDQASTAENAAEKQPDEFAFGDTYDGPVKTTIAPPEEFTTSQYAQPAGNEPAWKIAVTFENTTDQPFNIALLNVDGYSNDNKNKDVFDHAQEVGDAMETGELAPGTTATATYGFTGEPGAARKVTISSMDGSTTVTFTGSK